MSARPRVLLAWEGGAGRGHAVTLRNIVEALGDSCVFDAALCRMEHANVLQQVCDLVFQGSGYITDVSRRPGPGRESAATWADHLGDLGFGDVGILTRQIGWWLDVFRTRKTDVVVADFAPCASLAARIAGLGSVITGTGYLAPPPGLDQFPVFLPEYPQRHYDENQLLEAVNTALASFNAAPLPLFADIYVCDQPLIQTIAELDPFASARTDPYIPPQGDLPLSDGQGDQIFAYFSTDEHKDESLLTAIACLGPLVRLHMSNITEPVAARLAGSGVMIERRPIPFADIARRSRITINAGQHGSLTAALAMGLPQLAIPRHLEHLYHARRAQALGTTRLVSRSERDPAAITAAIMELYESRATGAVARTVADRLRPALIGPLHDILRQRLLPPSLQ